MLADVYTPLALTADELDAYLAKGWFRAGQTIFTTNFLHFGGTLYSALWLRLKLRDFELSKSQTKKIQASNRFDFLVRPFTLTDEKEQLYADYKTGIGFNTAASLHQLLFDYQEFSPFNTYEVAAYDNERLIGLGIFDVGEKAAAGIVSFVHPDYKKFSLGKVLILKKIQFSKSLGMVYFYPGYFAPGYPTFDYKLTFGKSCTEFLDVKTSQWLPVSYFTQRHDIIGSIYQKMRQILVELLKLGVSRELLIYDFFDLNLTKQFNGQGLLETPLVIPVRQRNKFQVDLLTYDLLAAKFQLLDCEVVYYLPSQEAKLGHYNKHILRCKRVIKEAAEIEYLFTPAS